MRHPRRRTGAIGLALAALAGGSALGAPPAHAGPDDGKLVATRTHVDAPKVFWENGGFALKNEAAVPGQSGRVHPLEKTVNWVGKGWGASGAQKYQFRVTGSPELAFLGKPGQLLYMAPKDRDGNSFPTWAGFGADTAIPIEKFRDRQFSLDVLAVDGPGDIEWFNSYEEDGRTVVTRFLSSREISRRTSRLVPGAHSHLTTTFTKPGRYAVTYRAVARGTDCAVIQSRPTTLVWQVGGAQPAATPSASLAERYAAAPPGRPATPYTVSVGPAPDGGKDGDKNLSRIGIDLHDAAANGTATVLIDGYHLTDVPVRGGTAHWDELLTSLDARIQVVFTPAAGSPGVRWASAPLTYRQGAAAVRTSGQVAALPTPTPDRPHEPAPTGPVDLKTGYTAKVEPDGAGRFAVSVSFDDPRLRGTVDGGFYDRDNPNYPEVPVTGPIVDGRHSYRDTDEAAGRMLKLLVQPHPDANLSAATIAFPQPHVAGETVTVKGDLKTSCGGAAPSPTPTGPVPTTPVPSPTTPVPSPTSPVPAFPACLGRAAVLDHGHIDLAASTAGGRLSFSLKDDTRILEPRTVLRDVNTVALRADRPLKVTRSGGMAGPEWAFLGAPGATAFVLPQTQRPGVIWPGYSTENVDYGTLSGPVTLELSSLKGPAGGELTLFSTDVAGRPEVILGSGASPRKRAIGDASHAHANWAFTRPGVYEVGLRYTATARDGRRLDTGEKVLKVTVATTTCGEAGAAGVAGDATGGGASADAPAVSPVSSASPVSDVANATGAPGEAVTAPMAEHGAGGSGIVAAGPGFAPGGSAPGAAAGFAPSPLASTGVPVAAVLLTGVALVGTGWGLRRRHR